MTTLLVAGCGYVGTELARRAILRGWTVSALSRTPRELSGLKWIKADLGEPSTLQNLGDFDHVVYAASAGASTEQAYARAYVDGPRNLIQALRERAGKFLFVSSTSVFAQDDGSLVDETSPVSREHFQGRLLLQGEGVVSTAGRENLIVRFSGIYGPGRTRLVDMVRNKTARIVPGVKEWTNRVHRDDCAEIIIHLLQKKNASGVWIGSDCEPVDRNTLFEGLARMMGVQLDRELEGAASPTERNKRCDNRRLLGSGYRFIYPTWREGYAAMLASMAGPS
jgi:nucleoside-diphosphate-sugar epimerase